MDKEKTYYWTKNDQGKDLLIIEVNGRRWPFGAIVLQSIERIMERDSGISVNQALEMERRHFAGWAMSDLKEEFEVLSQTPEYKKILETYNHSKQVTAQNEQRQLQDEERDNNKEASFWRRLYGH